MAYIRYGEQLPSGIPSASYVIGGPVDLLSFNPDSNTIPYTELVGLFAGKPYAEIREIIRSRLLLTDEEMEVVCDRLFEEHRAGEWERVPVRGGGLYW